MAKAKTPPRRRAMRQRQLPAPESGPQAVALGGEWTIYRASELRAELAAHLARGARCFDLSAVSGFDSSGLQLLAALRAAAGAGGAVRFVNPAACVRDACETVGLGAWLAL